MKNFLLLFLIIFTSCNNEYKPALDNYVREDLNNKQSNIDLYLEALEVKSKEQPAIYLEDYKLANVINSLLFEYEQKILNAKDLDAVNIYLNSLNDKLASEFKENPKVKSEKLPLKIENTRQKYDLLRQMKMMNFKIAGLELSNDLKELSNTSYVLPIRLNDSLVMLNFYSELAKKDSDYGTESFEMKKLTDLKDQKIKILKRDSDIYETYFIKSKLDTFYINAVLKSNRKIERVVSKIDTTIVVGEKVFLK
ncbi:hypothetical protein [Aureivirga sp. CE67]|uniref:hypothetical protein n=1 Tax=Aureivirga sp. CE67 TaxID=1788983 RepID=UPI0018CAABA1|nr:hypothetical protein [Aureivirga sp. CE67]